MERKGPTPQELQEIMRVPEVVQAMTMQRQNLKTEAMALLAEYKAKLEKSVLTAQQTKRQADPRQADPKSADPKAVDPRQSADPRQDPRQMEKRTEAALPHADKRPQDPRQAARQLTDPKQEIGAGKLAAEAQIADPRQKQARTAKQSAIEIIDDDDDGDDKGGDVEVVPETEVRRKILQGLPSLGFSEGWLRQFLDQVPSQGSMASQGG